MKLELMEAGQDVEGGYLIVVMGDEEWRIPTDATTALAFHGKLVKNAVRMKKIPYQGPDLDELLG